MEKLNTIDSRLAALEDERGVTPASEPNRMSPVAEMWEMIDSAPDLSDAEIRRAVYEGIQDRNAQTTAAGGTVSDEWLEVEFAMAEIVNRPDPKLAGLVAGPMVAL